MSTCKALTTIEITRLVHCESVIAVGLDNWMQVSIALLEIRDSRLYRKDFGSFELYCREKWKMSKRHANRLIASAKVIENVGPIGPTPEESQVRPLTSLSPDHQASVWKIAVESAPNGNVTANHVESVVEQFKQSSPVDRAAWEANKIPEPTNHEPSDEESDSLTRLKRAWRNTSKRDRKQFLAWIKTK